MKMARSVRNWWSHTKTVALIWSVCVVLYFSFFRMATKMSSSQHHPTAASSSGSDSDPLIANRMQRSKLYDKMARDLDEKGPAFLKRGETSQSLSLLDLFTLKDGRVTPLLKAANPPVRANVLYLNPEYSTPISEAVKNIFSPYFDKAIWFQNSSMYHFSMVQASHHISPVPASEDEIETEAMAVRAVAEGLCPLKIVLDRVVLTSTGVLIGCWQVISGTDPINIRARLRTALPRAPQMQLYDAAILHTSFARLLGRPKDSPTEPSNQLQFFHKLVDGLNNKIRGTEASVYELWYVEEYDVLALALNGRMKIRKFQLGCKQT